MVMPSPYNPRLVSRVMLSPVPRGFLPHVLEAVHPESPELEEAFSRYAAGLTRQLALLTAVLLCAFALLWWPLDAMVLPDQLSRTVFSELRMRGLAVAICTGVAFWVAPVRPVTLGLLAVGFYAWLMGSVGFSLGEMGGPDLGWLANAFVGVLPSAFIPLRFRWRLPATLVIAASLAAGFFVSFPLNQELSGAPGQLSFLAFVVVLTLLIGEFSVRVLRREFFTWTSSQTLRAELATVRSRLAAVEAAAPVMANPPPVTENAAARARREEQQTDLILMALGDLDVGRLESSSDSPVS
jgi:hypothetical protein